MHQFIGDLMTSSCAQPVKDSAQQEVMRAAWEAGGQEALGLRMSPAVPQAQHRQPQNKAAAGCSFQVLPEPVERNGTAAGSGQHFQHRTCTCPACPFSSFSSSSATLQALRSREGPSSQTHPSQVDRIRQSKESSAGPVGLGLCLGLGLSLVDEASDQIEACNVVADAQRQNSDRAAASQSLNASPHAAPHTPAFPCLCCHRGFQTCGQLLHHQLGPEAHFPHHRHYHHHHLHHCPLSSCQPCSQPSPSLPCLSCPCPGTFQTCSQLLRPQQGQGRGRDASSSHVLPCMHCAASFPRPSQLLRHQRSQHAAATGGFLCTECGRAFNSPSNLRVHLNVHTGARPYSCADCGKSFSQSGALKIHRRIHTGERPYACDFCGRGFPHLAGVRAHQRTHTGEKPYRCPQCAKCFSQSGALKIHLRIHTGERPFVCGVCGKGFSSRAGIRFHHRTAHAPDLLSSAIAGPPADPDLRLSVCPAPSPGASLSPNVDTGHPNTEPGQLNTDPSHANIDAGHPNTGTGHSNSNAGHPNTGTGHPNTGDGHPNTGAGHPNTGSGHPNTGDGHPNPEAGRPNTEAGCPNAIASSTSCLEASSEIRKDAPKKQPAYVCEDCGLCFRDAPSRNKHQEQEHYPDQGGEGAEGGWS